ncbi:GyrI-like domain-containing protein [Enterococcus sp. ALS3]|uniref:GyrI-like domain-containing protein n=1 Tax=Enterococcus alishanensis TaxID=1303817 RepID=A0ABS6TCB6_9ENTE|nr:GyrI-like domain-containing protein [Enterococcus alishanensis]MBV7390537.1 GyrI-like domain-containing protein [Enterococcus alishanensis]
MITPKSMTVERLEDLKIIYIRFRGSYSAFRKQSRKMFHQLFAFATENDLIVPDKTKVLTIYDDNPFITQDKNLRTSVAMTIPTDKPIEESGEITISNISGKFMVGHFEISAKEYGDAWQYMYQEWLFKHPDQIRDAVPFELYVTEPAKNYKDKSLTDIYIPIKN